MYLTDKYSKEYNRISQLLLENFLKKKPGENIVFSPFSVILLLGIAAHATDGKTREEILNVIAPEMDMEQLINILSELQKVLSENKQLISSNAVCVRSDHKKNIHRTYSYELSELFDGKLFTSKNMAKAVNKWVSQKTGKMITKLADEEAFKDAVACLMNAIAFEAGWAREYKEKDIFPGTFRNADGTVIETDMLHSEENLFIEDEFFRGVIKPYKNHEFSFMALLPLKDDMTFMINAARQIDFSRLFDKASHIKVETAIPEFKNDFSDELNDFCRESGIHDIFRDSADFSNMSRKNIKADKILHKAHIEVDRQGTKAAAVTAIINVVGCPPDMIRYERVILNRPFIYAVIHNSTGLPVFTGITNKIRGDREE